MIDKIKNFLLGKKTPVCCAEVQGADPSKTMHRRFEYRARISVDATKMSEKAADTLRQCSILLKSDGIEAQIGLRWTIGFMNVSTEVPLIHEVAEKISEIIRAGWEKQYPGRGWGTTIETLEGKTI